MSIFKAFQIIEENQDEADFYGEIDEQVILSAEKKLGVHLPQSYRMFIEKYGVGDIFGEEIYGLGVKDTGIPSMVWITEKLRKEDNLSESMICFYSTGYDGEYFCLNCSNVTNDYSPVVSFLSGVPIKDQPFEKIADDFGVFFYNLLTDSIDN